MARLALVLAAIVSALGVSQAYAAITASFECSPSCEVPAGTTVTFNSTSTTDGIFRDFAWDLDGDGLYGLGDEPDEPEGRTTTSAERTFAATGSYTVGLRARNQAGETDFATRTVSTRERRAVISRDHGIQPRRTRRGVPRLLQAPPPVGNVRQTVP